MVTFACAEGYYSSSDPFHNATCEDGVIPYIGHVFVCFPSCGNQPAAINGIVEYGTHSYISYSCLPGYTLKSGGTVLCKDGNWTSTIGIECGLSCNEEAIPAGNNTITDKSSSFPVVYNCLNGYHPDVNFVEPHVLRCVDNFLNSTTGPLEGLICIKDCDTLPTPTGAHVKNSNNYSIEYACDVSYIHTAGNLTIQCVNARWLGVPPTCLRNCTEAIPKGELSSYSYSGPPYAISVSYSCNVNTHPALGFTNPYTSLCREGVFSQPLKCEYDCNTSDLSEGVIWSVDMHSANATCDELWTLVGANKLICHNGTWYPSVPACRRNCDVAGIPEVANADRSISGPAYNQTYVYTCHNGYV